MTVSYLTLPCILLVGPPRRSPLFPYTTLFRSSLRAVVEREKPHLIVPEIEAIATPELQALEREGWHVIPTAEDRKSTRLNSSHVSISYAVFCLKKTTSSFCAAPFIDQKSALAT